MNFSSKDVQWRTNDDGDLFATIHPHRDSSDTGGAKVRVQAADLIELVHQHDMMQVIGQPTRKNEILDIMFTNNSELVHHVTSKSWDYFTDHNIVTITVNYPTDDGGAHEDLNEAAKDNLSIPERYSNLYYADASWEEVDSALNNVNWSTMSDLQPEDSLIWMHEKILSILEE